MDKDPGVLVHGILSVFNINLQSSFGANDTQEDFLGLLVSTALVCKGGWILYYRA